MTEKYFNNHETDTSLTCQIVELYFDGKSKFIIFANKVCHAAARMIHQRDLEMGETKIYSSIKNNLARERGGIEARKSRTAAIRNQPMAILGFP